jgi:type I restriction enzyme S subunit
MAAEWGEATLDDLVEVKHGFAFQGEFFHDEPPGDLLLTPGNFAIGGGFKSDKVKYFRGQPPSEFVLAAGDLLVTMTDLSKNADTLGYPALVPQSDANRYLHNQRLGKVLIKQGAPLEKRFLYYVLCSREYRNEVIASATGTTVKHTSPTRIGKFRFKLPSVNEQRGIAHVLGTIDDKIELNRRINETLEQMIEALFKSWFVDFDPAREKAEEHELTLAPQLADLFPTSFEISELGEIPTGWHVGQFGDVAVNLRRGVSPSEIQPTTPYIALEHMPRRSIALTDWGTAAGVESGKFAFCAGEILFGKLRPYFHKVGVAPVDGVCSTDILVVGARSDNWFGFLLGHISSVAFVEHANAGSTGTKMPRTNWSDMARYPVVLPPEPLAKAFTESIRPFVSRILASIHQSRTLAGLRDALLPKLISGQLRLPDADRIVEKEL